MISEYSYTFNILTFPFFIMIATAFLAIEASHAFEPFNISWRPLYLMNPDFSLSASSKCFLKSRAIVVIAIETT